MSKTPPTGSPPVTVCADCGTKVNGRFCSHCGAPVQTGSCSSCGAELAPGARFCHRCGTPAGTSGRARRERIAWLVAGIAILALGLAILWRGGAIRPAPPPDMANPGGAGPAGLPARAPDISNMSPEERFDRLFTRVMGAAESGDTTTVAQFSPMALGAYAMLPATNADLRFHAAMIRIAIGEYPGALALADTILAQSPGHLFGYLIRGEAADRRNQVDELNRAYREFLAQYDSEMRSGRPEYADHRPLIDDFRTRARASVPAS